MDDAQSEGCKALLDEGARAALTQAGIDPSLIEDSVKCVKDRDREQCAKTSAKIAAVYACSAATSGAGTTVCNKVAPVLIEKMWPVIGPPLTTVWDVGLDTLEALGSFLKHVVDAFGDLLGFGGDGPTKKEQINAITWAGWEVDKKAIVSGLQAAYAADIESRRELGLPVMIDGVVGAPNVSLDHDKNFEVKQNRSTQIFFDSLKRQEGMGEVCILGLGRDLTDTTSYGWLALHGVDPSTKPKDGQVMLRAPAMPAGWTPSSSAWSPARFTIEESSKLKTWHVSDIRDAAGMLLAIRTNAIRKASFDSIGRVIDENIRESQQPKPTSSSSWLIWMAMLGALGYLGYRYRKPIREVLR